MQFIGVDLAWGEGKPDQPANETGLVVPKGARSERRLLPDPAVQAASAASMRSSRPKEVVAGLGSQLLRLDTSAGADELEQRPTIVAPFRPEQRLSARAAARPVRTSRKRPTEEPSLEWVLTTVRQLLEVTASLTTRLRVLEQQSSTLAATERPRVSGYGQSANPKSTPSDYPVADPRGTHSPRTRHRIRFPDSTLTPLQRQRREARSVADVSRRHAPRADRLRRRCPHWNQIVTDHGGLWWALRAQDSNPEPHLGQASETPLAR